MNTQCQALTQKLHTPNPNTLRIPIEEQDDNAKQWVTPYIKDHHDFMGREDRVFQASGEDKKDSDLALDEEDLLYLCGYDP